MRNLLAEWCRLWVAALVDAGVHDFVICPGSRSTPLVIAIQQHPAARVVLNIDERSAAFFALGQAKRSGKPCAVLCTSGSAVAHFFPALIEAERTRTPLLLMSADRPAELQGNAAPQTIDQTQLFGNKVRAFIDLGAPEASALALRALQRKASQAVLATHFPLGGAVHVNIPARKPLEPEPASSHEEHALHATVSELIARGAPRAYAPRSRVHEHATALVAERIAMAQRPVLAIGPLAPGEAVSEAVLGAFQAATGWPIFAELPSQARSMQLSVCDAFDGIIGTWKQNLPVNAELVPDLVLHLGAPLISSAWAEFLGKHPEIELITASASDWADPTNQARTVVYGDLDAWLSELVTRIPLASQRWSALWAAANSKARTATLQSLEKLASSPFNEVSAVAELGNLLQAGDALVLGNSLPVRLADMLIPSIPGVVCISQRGANGIDGLVSMATGVATAHTGRTFLVVGDISALHDLSSLAALARAACALSVLVLNNQGGRIFETLPIAAHTPLDAWTTPHQLELTKAGELFGIPSYQARTLEELAHALTQSRETQGPIWIEALVEMSGASRGFQEIRANVALALADMDTSRILGSVE